MLEYLGTSLNLQTHTVGDSSRLARRLEIADQFLVVIGETESICNLSEVRTIR